MAVIKNPFNQWVDPTIGGRVIYNANIYVGQPDTDPTIPENRLQVYYIDENQQRINLAQPITTNTGGFTIISKDNPKIIQIEVDEDNYSITVKDRNQVSKWVIENVKGESPVITIDDVTGLRDELNDRIESLTLSDLQSKSYPVDKKVNLLDYDNAPVVIVASSDSGGYYYGNIANGNKIKLDYNINSVIGLNTNWFGLTYDSRGQTASEGTDNTATLQAAIDLIKTKPVGLFGEFTGGRMQLGFGGLMISAPLDLTNNAAVSVSGLGKTKSNLFASRTTTFSALFNLTGSNNSRNEIKGLRLTTVGGSEGVIRSDVSAFESTAGANQIDIKENWINNLKSVYSGVASDSSIKDNTAEFCRQFVSVNGGGSRDLDISENVAYNCGNIGLPDPSSPIFEFSDMENLTLTRNRVIADSAAGPFNDGIYKLTNVSNFDISDQKFNDTHSYVGEMFNITNSSGRLSDIEISSGTDRSLRAADCEYLEIDKYLARNEKEVQDDVGMSFVNCTTLKVGTVELGETGLVNVAIDGCDIVTIDTLILNGAKNAAAVGGGFDQALRIVNCDKVSINTIVIRSSAVGSFDVFADNTNTSVSIGRILGTTAGRVSITAVNSDVGAILP